MGDVPVAPLIVLLLSAPLVVFAILTFDSLVLIERERYPDRWVADGRPTTIYRRRQTFDSSQSHPMATHRCSLVWLFRTPRWIEDDLECLGLQGRLRMLVAVWTLVAVPAFLLSVLVHVLGS